jgi:hypothetical protein
MRGEKILSRQDAKHAKKTLSPSNLAAFAPLRETTVFRVFFIQIFALDNSCARVK